MQFCDQKFRQLITSSRYHGVVFLCFIFSSVVSYSQEKQQKLTIGTVDKQIHSTHQVNPTPSAQLLSPKEIQQSIDLINDHLSAIETKRVWINSSEERIVEANKNGWFKDMEATEIALIKRREELIVLLQKQKK